MPIGMLWVRISDIVEEMRRKKIESELQNSGWVSADMMGGGSAGGIQPDLQFQPPPGSNNFGPGGAPPGGPMRPQGAPQPQTGPVTIDDWFSLEPVGRIHLAMTFGKCASAHGRCRVLMRRQPSTRLIRHHSTSDLVEKALFARVKRTSSNSTATSSFNSNSTTLCAALSVESFSSTLPVCSVRTATTLAIKSVIRRWLPNVSRSRTPKPTPMRLNSTIVSPIDLRTFPTWALIGAVIVVIFCRLVESRQRSVQVCCLWNICFRTY
jgi:hypothetical protein